MGFGFWGRAYGLRFCKIVFNQSAKFEIFAITIKLYFCCFRGEEDHLKTAIALLVNKQSATFPLREKSGFSSPPPLLSLAGAAYKTVSAVRFIIKIGQQKILASANSHEIQCEHHLVADLFACGKFLLTRIAAEV